MNSWSGKSFYKTPDANIVRLDLTLSKKSYSFKLLISDTWYGNSGTISETTLSSSPSGWEFTTTGGDCTLKAAGATYTFICNTSTKQLQILSSKVVSGVYTVAGSKSAFGTDWDPSNTANDLVAGPGFFYKNVYLAKGDISFKVTNNHGWATAYPGTNYDFKVATAGWYRITYCPTDNSVNIYAISGDIAL